MILCVKPMEYARWVMTKLELLALVDIGFIVYFNLKIFGYSYRASWKGQKHRKK